MTTIGGVAFRHLDRLPRVGDDVTVEGVRITVLEMEAHRIARVRVARGQVALEREDEEPEGGDVEAGVSEEAKPETAGEDRLPAERVAASSTSDAGAKLAPRVGSAEMEDPATAPDTPDRPRSAAD